MIGPHLCDFPLRDAAPILPFFFQLYHISLRGRDTFYKNDPSSSFLLRLAKLPSGSLKRLTWDMSQPRDDGSFPGLPKGWSEFGWALAPSLQVRDLVIDVGDGPFRQSEWRFVEGMTRSLEILELVVGSKGSSSSRPLVINPLTTFPRLHTLRLTGAAIDIVSLLPAWLASSLTSLHLVLVLVLTSLSASLLMDDSSLKIGLRPHRAALTFAVIAHPARRYPPESVPRQNLDRYPLHRRLCRTVK